MAADVSAQPSKLYPIVDFGVCARHGVDPLLLANLAIAARPRWLQLRAKRVPTREFLTVVDQLVEPARAASVALVVNDRPDIASMAGAPWVHVGQGDLPVSDLARFDPRLRVGVSTHTPSELEAALDARPGYVACGPIFATSSKENAEPTVGLEWLEMAYRSCRARGTPLVAIGGIDSETLPDVARFADGVAVISALFTAGTQPHALAARLSELSALAGRAAAAQ